MISRNSASLCTGCTIKFDTTKSYHQHYIHTQTSSEQSASVLQLIARILPLSCRHTQRRWHRYVCVCVCTGEYHSRLLSGSPSVMSVIHRFMESEEPSCVHIALWITSQFSQGGQTMYNTTCISKPSHSHCIVNLVE